MRIVGFFEIVSLVLCAISPDSHIGNSVSCLYFLFQARRFYQYRKEEKDREAIQILHRIDAIGLKIMVAAAIAIAFASAVAFIDGIAAGYALVGTILAFAILRFVLFCAMYKTEI